nr:MAG TPA: hypothetical protein [Caudoviricetes sp.]
MQKPCSPTKSILSENFYSVLSFLTSNKSFHFKDSEIYLPFIPYLFLTSCLTTSYPISLSLDVL